MPSAAHLLAWLDAEGVRLITGVPDSLLQPLCSLLPTAPLRLQRDARCQHVISANEGASVALACGHFLATGRPAAVYLQNSGLGNVVNPLLSLAHPACYGIPALLIVGWRGEPGVADEPQHAQQGAVQNAMLAAMGLPFEVLPADDSAARAVVRRAFDHMRRERCPFVLVVRKGVLTGSTADVVPLDASDHLPSREAAVEAVARATAGSAAVVVSTTGKASRELFEARARVESAVGRARDFLCVGSMGHASSIALGIALAQPHRVVVVLDGDGAALMHLGALAVIAQSGAANLVHVVLNNGCHDSVGGLPTVARAVNLCGIATACGYASAERVDALPALAAALQRLVAAGGAGPRLLEVWVRPGARADLGRPTSSPHDNMRAFMHTLAASSRL